MRVVETRRARNIATRVRRIINIVIGRNSSEECRNWQGACSIRAQTRFFPVISTPTRSGGHLSRVCTRRRGSGSKKRGCLSLRTSGKYKYLCSTRAARGNNCNQRAIAADRKHGEGAGLRDHTEIQSRPRLRESNCDAETRIGIRGILRFSIPAQRHISDRSPARQ